MKVTTVLAFVNSFALFKGVRKLRFGSPRHAIDGNNHLAGLAGRAFEGRVEETDALVTPADALSVAHELWKRTEKTQAYM